MAIRDRFRRMRNSISSTGTASQTDGNSDSSPPEPKSPLRLTKTFTWRRSSKDGKKNKEPKDSREKPFTETNLKHQELLSSFTMTFGKRKPSSGGRSSYSGVSPGTSRQPSLDHGHIDSSGIYRRRSTAIAPDAVRVPPVMEEGPKA